MDKAQATEIQRHLLAVGDAIDEASALIVELDTEDRAMFAGLLESSFPVCIMRCWR
jgi:hypothetical protein